ncbi:Protein like [Actinidia chinensis var. chinensis]|uniref:Protein like n=1 Tax=Actinidia chinensis var. chinensis TaxID=1590841 RepID=A0A2R6PUG6_ACTCC|nr:Protein like [Actinidia chinensis var. chinensis]
MVAISLYRGNLHRVPDVPRRWLMPAPKISLKDFRILLNLRSRALSRLHSSTTSSYPNPTEEEEEEDERENNGFPINDSLPPPQSDQPKITTTHLDEEGNFKEGGICEEEANDRRESDGGDGSAKLGDGSDASKDAKEVPQSGSNPVDANDRRGSDGGDGSAKLVDGSDASKDAKEVPQSDSNPVDANDRRGSDGGDGSAKLVDGSDASNDAKEVPQSDSNPQSLENKKAETSTKVDALTDKEMRKKEIEEKLLVLNEKKRNLVSVVKQILNAEEELKRRNSMRGTGIRPAVPLQVDATNDS